mmetsp:Transcript_7997/g.26580  ORF Transcript_7997/g.26580 Transcript_7997/m.26580 type:complete len:256 (-) Transcript_7997:112-879(-)
MSKSEACLSEALHHTGGRLLHRRADGGFVIEREHRPRFGSAVLTGAGHAGRAVLRTVDTVRFPKGPSTSDTEVHNKLLNVVTCLPYVMVAWRALRRDDPACRNFGRSMIVTAALAGGFHAADGKLKTLARKVDYMAAATSLVALSNAVVPAERRKGLNCFSALALPLNPLAVFAANYTSVVHEYKRRSTESARLRRAYHAHVASALIGLACFASELKHPTSPGLHASWHLLSAAAAGTVEPLFPNIKGEEEEEDF